MYTLLMYQCKHTYLIDFSVDNIQTVFTTT